MIKIGKSIATDPASSTSLEWLETNGIGGYASGTVSGAHTRRYHGALVAATRPPVAREVLLSKFEETLIVDGERFELSTNQYPGAVYPRGYELLAGFRLDPFPIWTYKIGSIELEKKLFMLHGENTTVISWTIRQRKRNDRREITLELRPLLAFRDHHHLRHGQTEFHQESAPAEGGCVAFTKIAGGPTLFLAHNAARVDDRDGNWYRNFEYAIERERGFDFTEDLFQPSVLAFDLSTAATVIASTQAHLAGEAAAFEMSEVDRRKALIRRVGSRGDLSKRLVVAADQFIVRRGVGHTVIAGYPWFSDWGRDTMIALPGLTLATGRPEIAKSILAEFAKYISEGMLPNRFPDEGQEPEYNTADATLWYFEAIRAYAAKTGDNEFVRDWLYPKLVDIIAAHVRGTRYGIHVDTDGLLHAGEEGVQLTWMDAKVGDRVVTPRTGKPVEIQALWYNTLAVMAEFAKRFGDDKDAKRYREMAAAAKASFNGQFWNADKRCLYDVVNGGEKDAAVRPNQIFAVSLPNSIIDTELARAVVDKVETELLTSVGLRSLAASDPRYVPIYEGAPEVRDAAYHQGTVWAWLIGPFIDGYRKTHPDTVATRRRVKQLLAGFEQHLTDSMLGQVAEIFDAEPPHYTRGAGAQAWSVAELLRVTV
jgi:predicted glycogen debranching enzyme